MSGRPLACQRDPERWFDRTDRTGALAACLRCPARAWCAREALTARPSFGMWAGIFIDHNLPEMTGYLKAIAEDGPPPTPPPAGIPAPEPRPAPRPELRPPPLPDTRAGVAARIAARASGHCEILAPDCRLSAGGVVSRLTRRPVAQPGDPAAGYLCCPHCRDVVAQLDRRLARRLGYLLDARRDPAGVPFYWRQNRWVLLDSVGSARVVTLLDRPA